MNMRDLINKLNYYTNLYDEGNPAISDKEWDELYFTLKKQEEETGIIYPDSPTQNIHFEKVSKLNKMTHNHPMLSLDKTKDINDIKSFCKSRDWIAMAKMDGLTCSLKYLNGKLVSAETRGNGIEGEDITHNAKIISSIPQQINYKNKLIVDGEIICTYENFKQFEDTYKNPRNFASGSIRLLDAKECEKRKLSFVAWDAFLSFDEKSNFTYLSEKLDFIKKLGFSIVPSFYPDPFNTYSLDYYIDWIKKEANKLSYPIDGVVFKYDSIQEYEKAGRTDHHFKGGLAYKFYDETYETYLKYIQWTMGRTGVLTPVAIFEPIDIEGSIVERASLHNLSVMENILGIPFEKQKLQVFKANMIVPQIYSAEKPKEKPNSPIIPLIEKCPICGEDVEIINNNGVKIIVCTNPSCQGKFINILEHFCGKKGLDIKGLSKATFQKLIDWGWLENLEGVFNLNQYRNEWIKKPGFGIASVDKILKSIEEHRHTTLDAFISAIGIPLIGRTVAKDLTKYFKTYEDFRDAVMDDTYNFFTLDNFGEEMNNSIKNFDYAEADRISKLLIFEAPVVNNVQINNSLTGKTIVITGKLTNFKNRAELKSIIEAHGGKVTDSISAKTNILINNDVNSTSSKNKAAKARNIPIVSELDFMKQYIEN